MEPFYFTHNSSKMHQNNASVRQHRRGNCPVRCGGCFIDPIVFFCFNMDLPSGDVFIKSPGADQSAIKHNDPSPRTMTFRCGGLHRATPFWRIVRSDRDKQRYPPIVSMNIPGSTKGRTLWDDIPGENNTPVNFAAGLSRFFGSI